jgi:type III secretion system (T3SS) inner membrane Yop/YscD-like protein
METGVRIAALRVTEGPDRGRELAVGAEGLTIGRDPTCGLVLSDPRVSRRHAALRVDGTTLVIEDLGSTGGTRVNGFRLDYPVALGAGDRVRAGGTELLLVDGTAPVPGTVGLLAVAGPAATGTRAAAIVLAAIAVLGAGLLLGTTWAPYIGGVRLWDVPERRLAGLNLAAAGLALALAAGLVIAWLLPRGARARSTLAVGLLGAGGLASAVPLAALAQPSRAPGPSAWVALSTLGAALVVGGAAGAVAVARKGRPPIRPGVGTLLPWAVACGVGAALAAAATALGWWAQPFSGGVEISGLETAGGRLLLPAALLTLWAVSLPVILAAAGARRAAAAVVPIAVPLACAGLGCALTGIASGAFVDLAAGVHLAVAGAAIAAVAATVPSLLLAIRSEAP